MAGLGDRRFSGIRITAAAWLMSMLLGCGGSDAPSGPGRIIAGVDLDELFAAPTVSEKKAVKAEWAKRDVSAVDAAIVAGNTLAAGQGTLQIHIVSHRVDDVLHYGAVIVPEGAAPHSLPMLVYAHEGDNGIDLDFLLQYLPLTLDDLQEQFVFVVPSFRGERLRYDDVDYQSEGGASPWDRDVDDALALVQAAAELFDAADPMRVGILGFSRGATVGMLMAIRNPQIDAVVSYYGPTDFLGPFVEDLVIEALEGQPRDLPGVQSLNEQLIAPLADGVLSVADVRLGLLRRSPLHFAADLPRLMLHHGTADDVVPVHETERLIQAMVKLGRNSPEFVFHIHQGAGHSPLGMLSSLPESRAFLEFLTTPSVAVF